MKTHYTQKQKIYIITSIESDWYNGEMIGEIERKYYFFAKNMNQVNSYINDSLLFCSSSNVLRIKCIEDSFLVMSTKSLIEEYNLIIK
jgi:hypothetical protein